MRDLTPKDRLTFMYFTAAWCGPCKMYSPVIEAVAKQSEHEFQKIDIDENAALTEQYLIRGVPTVICLLDGNEFARSVGLMSEARLRSFIAEAETAASF